MGYIRKRTDPLRSHCATVATNEVKNQMLTPKGLNKEIRCIFFATNFPPVIGGSATVYEAFAKGLKRNQCSVLATSHRYENQSEIENWREYDSQAPFRIDRMKYMRPLERYKKRNILQKIRDLFFSDIPIQLNALLHLIRTIKSQSANVLIIGELRAGGLLGRIAKRLTGIKLVFFIHGEELSTRFNSRLYGKNSFENLRRCDAIITVSSFTKDLLCESVGVDPRKVHLIPNGVDTERFFPAKSSINSGAVQRVLHKPTVLSLGRLVPRKGFDYCIEAWPQVLEKIPDAHYLLVGDGPYRDALEQRVVELGLQHSVTFYGRAEHDEIPDLYRLATCFAMPNRTMDDGDTEGFGLVFLEANACGKAVIAGNAGGAPDAVSHMQNGLLVDGTSINEIAAAMILLLSESKLRFEIENKGLQRAQQSSWQARVEELQLVLRQSI
jgi:phosphatidyl-myo-inositol dimannoside synthase